MTVEDLAHDIEYLKAENRRLKRWGAGILLFGLALGGMAMAQEDKVPEVVRAKGFQLVTDDGRVSAEIRSYSDDNPHLLMFDKDQSKRVDLGLIPPGYPQLNLRDKGGEERLTLSVGPDGTSSVCLTEDGHNLVNLAGWPGGHPRMFFGTKAHTLASLINMPDGTPRFTLFGPDGKTLFKVPE